jgi:Fe-S-cluster-containing hydrogenase component 2
MYHWNIVNPHRSAVRVEKISVTEDIQHVCAHGKDCAFECVDACKFDAMTKKNDMAIVDYEKCTGCKQCEKACPIAAVWIFEKKAYKCDLCNGKTLCVTYCSQNALEIGE